MQTTTPENPFQFQDLFEIGSESTFWKGLRLLTIVILAAIRLPFILLAVVVTAIVSWLVVFLPTGVMHHLLGWTARYILFILGILNITVTDKRTGPSTAPIMVSNHVSYLDILVIMSLYGTNYSFVAQNRLKEAAWLRRICDSFGIIWVDQTKSDGTTKRMLQAISKGRKLVLFPEGLMTNGESMLRFRKGAFVLGQSIKPICIKWAHIHPDDQYGRVHFSPAARPHIMSTPAKVWHLLRMMGEPYTPVSVVLLDDYHPTLQEIENPEQFAENCRQIIAKETNCKLSERTFLDWIDTTVKH